MKVSYYAIFEYDNDGINISFPDLPGCLSCAWSNVEAQKMAKEAMELYIRDIPIEKLPIPSSAEQIYLKKNEMLFLITRTLN
ncbi:type II toxin-antitoxin system HicB family antitoxin [Bacillus sp. UNCCL81]|uniref:type II toxin-antitoxin system HicB family antitoxin n=1 Tax=Bacillus sp. UNCCL81 TaxID=1502755 RepID=UPI0003FD7785|nr:type II toxin-antitoxin system HicB family antitoxin [Bacillus sp. UNCCL81]SFD61036.1 Predicted nuclease of the RNAse H fold, HicB family [Bacillus sp. UNCCL81]